MRCSLYFVALLLAGCASGGGEIELGVGKTFRDGGFSAGGGGGGSGHSSHTEANAFIDYDEADTESVWLSYSIPLGPKQIEIVNPSVEPVYIPAPPVVIDHRDDPGNNNLQILGMEIPTDTNPLLVLAVAAVAAVAGRFGFKRVQRKRKGGA